MSQVSLPRETIVGFGTLAVCALAVLLQPGCEKGTPKRPPDPGKYRLPEEVPFTPRSAEEDLKSLATLAEKYNGKLWTDEDKTVKWYDTRLYRLYEFRHHTVVVFPHNWDEMKFDIDLIAGHIRDKRDLSGTLDYRYSDRKGYQLHGVLLDTEPKALLQVGMFGMCLGQRRGDVVRHHVDYLRKESGWEGDQLQLRIRNMSGKSREVSDGERDGIQFVLHYENGRVTYISFSPRLSPRRGQMLTSDSDTVLTQGVATLPQGK